MLFENLHPDAPRLPEHTAKRIVQYGEKRLKKCGVNAYLPISISVTPLLPNTTTTGEAATATSSIQNRIHPQRLQVGRLLGQGSFSSAYEITSFGGDEESADDGDCSSDNNATTSTTACYTTTTALNNPNNTPRLVVKVLQPKLIEKPALFAGCAADLVREGIILSKLRHVNVLQCHALGGAGAEEGSMQAFGSGRHDACFLVLERLDSTLKEKLVEWRQQAHSVNLITTSPAAASSSSSSSSPSSSEEPLRPRKSIGDHLFFLLSGGKHRRMQQSLTARTNLLCELAEAIRYLHVNRIMHRDLKPDNLGVVLQPDGTLTLKVFDLDVCRIMPPEARIDDYQTFHFTKHVGSPRYMAPEIARGEEYNAKADVYSFGLLAYQILSLKKPFADIPSKELESQVFYEGVRPFCPASWPRPVTALLHRCWSNKILVRPTMAQITKELRDTLDRMCPPSEVKQRRLQQQVDQDQTSSILMNNKRRSHRRIRLEESRTHRSESTIEVASLMLQ